MPSPNAPARYAVVSPVKDEARFIELTLRAMISQTLRPVSWIIVDDASSDATAAIVRPYAERHSFIHLTDGRTAGPRKTGSAEVHAFNRGYALLSDTQFDFIVKLDGDLSFESDYFGTLLERFQRDQRLGIASGVYLEQDKDGLWKVVTMPSYHAFGACKVIRRACFEAIGGFLATPGWDTVDEIRAMNLGWTTGHFTDLEVKHHKPEGTGMGLLRTSAMHGAIHYVTAGDPLFLALKVVRRLTADPFLFNGLALLVGYLLAFARRKPILLTKAEAEMYRRILRGRMWRRAESWTRLPARQ